MEGLFHMGGIAVPQLWNSKNKEVFGGEDGSLFVKDGSDLLKR